MVKHTLDLNSSPIDELWNWCQERLVEAPRKHEVLQGGFHGDPVSRNQPCQRPPGSDFQPGWEWQGSKFASEAM